VAAPDEPVIADFDHGDTTASYGLGFSASDDKMRGGNSSAAQKIIDGALEVSAKVGTAIQYPSPAPRSCPMAHRKPTGPAGIHGLLAQADAELSARVVTATSTWS
jgi:hypothetical protein